MWQTRKIESVFKLKDKNTHPSHVIYKDECICAQTYIGETARNLEVHMGSFNHCPFMVKKENKKAFYIARFRPELNKQVGTGIT